jgi:ketosteroid isomerase-like protein
MKTLFAVLLVSSLIPPVAAQDDSTATAVYTIIALEKAWNQAFKFRDTRAMDILLDDGALLVNDDGTLQSKGEFLSGIRESKPSDEEQVTPESISVRIFGGVGIATGIFRAKEISGGKIVVKRNRFVDTWMEKNHTWVCVSASATPVLH